MVSKLKNKQGVTMLMALLFLLVAMMVSAVVLAAAVTAVKTADDDRGQQQAYLNVSSAAKLLEKELRAFNAYNGQGMYLGLREIYTNYNTTEQARRTEIIRSVPQTAFMDTLWAKFVTESQEEGAKFSLPANRSFRFQITAPNMGTVEAIFTISENTNKSNSYIGRIQLNNLDESYPCTLYLHMVLDGVSASDAFDVGEGTNKEHWVEKTMTYTWSSISVSKKEDRQ